MGPIMIIIHAYSQAMYAIRSIARQWRETCSKGSIESTNMHIFKFLNVVECDSIGIGGTLLPKIANIHSMIAFLFTRDKLIKRQP